MADTDLNIEAAPKPAAHRRRRLDIYDIRHIVRMIVTLGIAGVAIYGAVLGDIWLWRLLYG